MTEAWIVPTEADLKQYLVAAGVDAFESSALGSGQANPFTEHMPSCVAKVRAYIKGCQSNVLSATENSVPLSLKSITCLLILEAMEGRMSGVNLTERQQKALDRGIEDLRMIAKCELPIAAPDDPAEDAFQTGTVAEVLSSTCLTTKRCQTAGL